jgi:multidrug efflux system membrane fusion protein
VFRLNLGFTQVKSPTRRPRQPHLFTVGNLVSQDQTLLTTVVSTDPVYAYFDMDERTVLRVLAAINSGRIKASSDGTGMQVLMALEGEEGFPRKGTIDFVNNVVNPSTGTKAWRGKFDNPKPPNGVRLLSPGMFVRVRLPIGDPAPGLLVVDRAVASDQGLKYVYVVGPDSKVKYQRCVSAPWRTTACA